MATLVSPGVHVSIIDESLYATAGPGTIPLIVIATAANKTDPSGTGFATYTLPERANQAYLVSSQRELVQNYGNPNFYNVQGTPLHGHELNEYGLLAAYQYLGISNRAYILRADIDLAQLEASVSAPSGPPLAGTYWLDLASSRFGLFLSNGNPNAGSAWVPQTVRVITQSSAILSGGLFLPDPAIGSDGEFAIVVASTDNKFYEKVAGVWYEIGSAAWAAAHPTEVRSVATPPNLGLSATTMTINGQAVSFAANDAPVDVVNAINAASITDIVASLDAVSGAIIITNTAGQNIIIADNVGTPALDLGIPTGTKKGVQVYRNNDAQWPAGSVQDDIWIKGMSANNGANWSVKLYNGTTWLAMTASFFPFDSTLADGDANKDAAAIATLGVPAVGTVYVGYDSATGIQVLRRFNGTNWTDLIYEASATEPETEPGAGTLWYNTDFRVDIMVGDGNTWMGYRRRYPNTDPLGVILSGSAPLTQSDGSPLEDFDLWIDTTDLENYPAIHRYEAATRRWRRVDNTDQTSPFGIVFADARQDSGQPFVNMPNAGSYAYDSEDIADMLESDFLDPDAPDPRTYPDGMLLFNTRYSTYNVKEWKPNHFKEGDFDENTDFTVESYRKGDPLYEFPPLTSSGRWVTISGNRHDGAPHMGRKAQRAMVVRAMQAAVASNEDIRSELIYYNLMAAPGYPELIDEMVSLNVDNKEFAFIIGDTPARLAPVSQDIQNWALNANLAPSNGEEGLTSASMYVGVYYPWGLTTNLDGTEVMVPPSSIALRTIAYNDQVAYPWFAPAGFTRGLVTNAASVGYLTSEGEYQPIYLNQGQRDVLYLNKINPIAFIPGRGLVVYGQKTLHTLSSALDRINVARLTNYLRFNLDQIMKPFLFEPNDEITQNAARVVVERFLSGIMTLRGITDFAVVCDSTNNTPERVDRNELWVDVALIPTKAVEFIYIPIRIRNSGDNLEIASA